jgi:hypothetical protein
MDLPNEAKRKYLNYPRTYGKKKNKEGKLNKSVKQRNKVWWRGIERDRLKGKK